jgi:2'-5' RNA ligase
MQHSFPPPFGGRPKPPALMVRRLRRRQEAVVGPATDRLFLAVVPDAETADRIAQTARHLRVSHGLSGKPLRPEHFHVTLCHIEDGVGLTPGKVEEVSACAARVEMPSFRVCFDRAESFRNGALVLRGDDGTIGLDILQQRLSDAFDGEPRKARSFTPHVTLLRDGHRVPEQPIEPIEWTVREVVLVHSLLGRTTHRHIARWTLGNA